VDKWNDFAESDSIWKVYLEDDKGARLSPVSVSKLDASDPLLREFFPYMDLWSSAYSIKFPKYSETGTEPIPNADTRSMRLVVTGVLGKFERGDTISIVDDRNHEIARGLTNYSAAELSRIKGIHTSEIAHVLGHKDYDEVVHRDNLVVLED